MVFYTRQWYWIRYNKCWEYLDESIDVFFSDFQSYKNYVSISFKMVLGGTLFCQFSGNFKLLNWNVTNIRVMGQYKFWVYFTWNSSLFFRCWEVCGIQYIPCWYFRDKFVLPHDNAPTHLCVFVHQFLTKRGSQFSNIHLTRQT